MNAKNAFWINAMNIAGPLFSLLVVSCLYQAANEEISAAEPLQRALASIFAMAVVIYLSGSIETAAAGFEKKISGHDFFIFYMHCFILFFSCAAFSFLFIVEEVKIYCLIAVYLPLLISTVYNLAYFLKMKKALGK